MPSSASRFIAGAFGFYPSFKPPRALKSIYNSNDCVWVGSFALDYWGVRYTIRAGIEPNLWSISIYPDGIESRANRAYGSRKDAEFQAHSMIDGWLQKQSGLPSRRKSNIADAKRKSIAEWAQHATT